MMMRILLALLTLIFLFSPHHVLAHMPGQPPFLKVNGKYANFYNVPSASVLDFPLPQDAPPDHYLVNTPIHLAFDTNRLPVPQDIIKKTIFAWDFGDGSKGEGLANDHTYTKMGSYLVTITADDGTTPTPQLLESIMLHVLPNPSYQLPKADIQVNGNRSHDPANDILATSFADPIRFNASASTAPSSQIAGYYWDFGDGVTNTAKLAEHTYQKDLRMTLILLRVKDKNGFIADSYVQLDNDLFQNTGRKISTVTPQTTAKKISPPQAIPWLLIFIVAFVLGALAVFLIRLKARSRVLRR